MSDLPTLYLHPDEFRFAREGARTMIAGARRTDEDVAYVPETRFTSVLDQLEQPMPLEKAVGVLRQELRDANGTERDGAVQTILGALSASHAEIARLDKECMSLRSENGKLRDAAYAAIADVMEITNLSRNFRRRAYSILGKPDAADT